MKIRLVAALTFVVLTTSLCVARTLDYADLHRIITYREPQISPDGRYVAYLRSRVEFLSDRNHTDLMLIDAHTRIARHLTYDRRGIASPRWSPSGDRIAFLASAQTGKEQQQQIFVMPMNGGDALQVSAAPRGVDRFAWSPDGRRFAFVSQDEAPDKKRIEKHLDAFEVGDNDYLRKEAAVPSHLWTITSAGGKAVRLTSGSFSLSTVEPDVGSELSWSGDGRYIAFLRLSNALYGDSLAGTVYTYDMQAHRLAQVTTYSGYEGAPLFAPEGSLLAYDRSTRGNPTNGVSVEVTRRGSGDGADIRRALDRSIEAKLWLPDASGLLLTGLDRGHSRVWEQPLHGTARALDVGNLEIAQVDSVSKTGAIAMVANRSTHPGELYYLASSHAKPVALTKENAWADRLNLGRVQTVTWHGPDGFVEDGILTFPPQYRKGKRLPLVLLVHGGPQSASTQGWNSRRLLLASHGYLVFEPNYRGSTDLGDRYERAIARDAGLGPGKDAMAGVAAVQRMGIVDNTRIAVSGWSYGGYMTSWLEGHYHIWKAAVAGAALNDWFDDYNVSFYVNTDVPFFGASPWNARVTGMWREQSPISYAANIKTPTLLMHDTGDNNVTPTNSYKMFHALKDNGVPVEFWAIPVHGHFPTDPVRSEDINRHWLAWLDRYLK